MDTIQIDSLEVQAYVGVPDEERRTKQRILIDVELRLCLKEAGEGDRIEETIDYAAVVREIEKMVEVREFQLVEALTESISSLILERFRVDEVKVRVRKFSVPLVKSVGVQISRLRNVKKQTT